EWSSRAGGSAYDLANDLALDAQGNIYVTGYFSGTCYFPGLSQISSSGGSDFYLAKMNSAGNWVWARSAGANYSDEGKAVCTDQDGNVIVAGRYRGNISFGPLGIYPESNYPLFIAKADPQGNWIWANTNGGTGNAYFGGLCMDTLGNVYLAGSFSASLDFASHIVDNVGGNDIFIAKASSTGAWQWAIQCGDVDSDSVNDIEIDSGGNLWISGSFEFPIQFGNLSLGSLGASDIYIAKLNPAGDWTWAIRSGGANSEYFGDLYLDGLDNAFICGEFNGTTTLGNTILNPLGNTDGYVLKYGLAAILLSPDAVDITLQDDDVLISWTPVSGASAYRIEASDLPEGTYMDISDSGVFTDNSFRINLPGANKKFYRVTAIRE
ncbi:MAG: SBBP repeat-containing protein, partial [Candidatus Cloacimonetes bacterium]|nr:SBBP repeat-containing protein [Candidatus Cloacimonadota bacterium]